MFFENFNGALALLVFLLARQRFSRPFRGGESGGGVGEIGGAWVRRRLANQQTEPERTSRNENTNGKKERASSPKQAGYETEKHNEKKKNQHFHQNKGLQARSASFKAGIVREVARGRRRIVSSAQKAAGCAVGSDASD